MSDMFDILFAQKRAEKKINEYVDDYCEEHFAQETGYVLDDTLTLENAAAQAKAVGEVRSQVTELKEDLGKIYQSYVSDSIWESGGISSSNGSDAVTGSRIRTSYIDRNIDTVTPELGYKVCIYAYNSSETYIGVYNGSSFQTGTMIWFTEKVDISKIDGTYKIRLVGANTSDSSISTSAYDKFIFEDFGEVITEINEEIKNIQSDIHDLDEFEEKVFSQNEKFISVDAETAPNAILKSSYYCTWSSSTKMEIKSNDSYKTFYLKLDSDAKFYCASGSSLFRICTIKNGIETESGGIISITGTNSTEYNSGSFPTSENPISLEKGDYIAVCALASNELSIMMLFNELSNTVILGKRQINQILKPKYLQYISGSGDDSSTERLCVYIPSADGYVRYDFLHTVYAAINSDVWRVGYAYHVNDNFVQDYAITTTGEWECAVKLDGRNDFSGGYAHGDEVMNNIVFIVDGSPVDITTFTTLTEFDDLCIIEDSKLYDPDDSVTVYANHGSEHHFTYDGMTVKQSLKFVLSETVIIAYMAMLPIAKAVSNYVVPDSTFVPLSTNSAIRIYNTENVVIYKSDGKVKAEFGVPKWGYISSGDYTFMCLDNGSNEYNKCYFVNALSSTAVPSERLLKTETHYNFIAT